MIKELIKDWIERTENVLDVLTGGVLGGLATHLVLIEESGVVLKVIFGLIIIAVLIRLIRRFWLNKK